MNLNSKRLFTVVFLEDNFTFSDPGVSLNKILFEGGGEEYKYAIADNIDNVLDLKIGERLIMNFNRDNSDSQGFIKRIR